MTPQELKNSILKLAIQGKLVEQRPEEGTAEELFKQIQAEKQALIKAGKIKKEKPLPEITEEEKPLDIPDSWKWVLLDELVCKPIKRGKSPTYTAKSGTLVFAQKCNTKKGYIDISLALYLDESKLCKYPEEEFMRDKDIVINSTGGGTMGRVGFYQNGDNPDNIPIVPDSHVTIIRVANNVCAEYVLYVIKSYQPYMEKQGAGSTNQTELNAAVIRALQIPLPPIAEQKRIVAKIEELLPLIDRYEEAWTKLEEFNKRFPGDMQKSLLQMAIQGKLVEQRPEEGTGEELYQKIQTEKQALIKSDKIKKDKPLPEIADDEKPFDIPESWKWVRWGEIVNIVSARRVHQSDWKSDGIPFYRAREIAKLAENGCVENELFISQDLFDEFSKSGVPQAGDLMVTAVGTLGKTYIVKSEDHFYYKDASVICFENFAGMLPEYLKYVMQSEMMKNQIKSNSDGTTVATLTMVRTVEYVLPLPPLDEQKRIVAKLEELLPLCEGLK